MEVIVKVYNNRFNLFVGNTLKLNNDENLFYISRDPDGTIGEFGFTKDGIEVYTLINGWDRQGNPINEFTIINERYEVGEHNTL